MCQSVAEGGLRCAAHTRGPFGRATYGTDVWDAAAKDYASTREGRAVLSAMIDMAVDKDVPEMEAHLRTILAGAEAKRAAAKEIKRTVSSAKGDPVDLVDTRPEGSSFPAPDELDVPFMSSTPRRGRINEMYWDKVDRMVDKAFDKAGVAPEDCHRFKVLVVLGEHGWQLKSPQALVAPRTGDWSEITLGKGQIGLSAALNDVVPRRMDRGQVLQLTGVYDMRERVALKMQKVTAAL